MLKNIFFAIICIAVANANGNTTAGCRLPPHPSVEYRCRIVDSNSTGPNIEGYRACNEHEPEGAVVLPECRAPNYYNPAPLPAMHCVSGSWDYVAICTPATICIAVANANRNITAGCRLPPHPSVKYRCRIVDPNSLGPNIEGYRACNEHEPEGAVVLPECRAPHYYSPAPLPAMHCVSGSWDYVATCTPECGTITPVGLAVSASEPSEDSGPTKSARRGEVPWHAVVYSKTTVPYTQLCGGSLVSDKLVISAARCFWKHADFKAEPASQFVVAVGKQFRPWTSQEDDQAQTSDVKEIVLPVRFQGAAANYQDDIAMVIVSTAFELKPFIRPVCVDFDINFERRQLQVGKSGKVAGWGLTAENGNASQVLKVVELPYVNVETCIAESPPDFDEYITSDKICAGLQNGGKALCKGDSGGGLAFPEYDKGTPRYYLRGVVSTAPNNNNLCNVNTYTSFTQVLKHEAFIKQFWTSSYL